MNKCKPKTMKEKLAQARDEMHKANIKHQKDMVDVAKHVFAVAQELKLVKHKVKDLVIGGSLVGLVLIAFSLSWDLIADTLLLHNSSGIGLWQGGVGGLGAIILIFAIFRAMQR